MADSKKKLSARQEETGLIEKFAELDERLQEAVDDKMFDCDEHTILALTSPVLNFIQELLESGVKPDELFIAFAGALGGMMRTPSFQGVEGKWKQEAT
jgi:hypothetical protein